MFNLSIEKARGNSKAKVKLAIFQIDYLFNIFIPFLESLNFQSKKKLDFNECLLRRPKLITTLIYQGKHLKPEIKDFILECSYTMNNFRLSTFNNLAKKNHNNLKPTLTTPFTEQSSPLKDEICEAVARPEFEFINLRSASQLQLATEQYLNLSPVYIKTSAGTEARWSYNKY